LQTFALENQAQTTTMTVTELALLRFLPGVVLDETILETLKAAKFSMEKVAGHTCHYYTQDEDPSLLYIIGEWESVKQHIEQWMPSKENRAVMDVLADKLEVIWMYHIDVQPSALPLDDPIVCVIRYFVPAAKKGDFQRAFEEGQDILASLMSPQKVGGGWRIDKEAGDKEEWVLFSGWDSCEQHTKFRQGRSEKIWGHAWDARIQYGLAQNGVEERYLRKLETLPLPK
jgi:heme-degrading monooxygenase HmoA